MLIEVIPFDASIDDRGLTYYVSPDLVTELEIGSLVEIPIKNLLGPAVVAHILPDAPETDIRSISRVICAYPILAPYQVETIYSLSSRYFVHIHKVLNLFFPKSLLTSFEKKDFRDIDDLPLPRASEPVSRRNEVIFNRTGNSIFPILETKIASNEAMVCVFPDDFGAIAFSQYLREKGMEITPFLQSDTPTRKYQHYVGALKKRNTIIIWSRKILYYNLRAYEHILYIEDAFGKSTMNAFHTYKHMDTLSRIAKLSVFSVSIISSVPSIESMSLALRKEYELINI